MAAQGRRLSLEFKFKGEWRGERKLDLAKERSLVAGIMTTALEIEAAIRKLPRSERRKLDAWREEEQALLASAQLLAQRLDKEEEEAATDAEVEQAWKEETQRRIAELESGAVKCVDGPTVMAQLRRITCRR